MLGTRHIAGLSNERVNGACNFPKPLKSRAIDEESKEKIGNTNIKMAPGLGGREEVGGTGVKLN